MPDDAHSVLNLRGQKMSHILRMAAILIALAGIYSTTALAASVSLVPSSATVVEGGVFSIDLTMNAADAPGSHPGLFGGEIIIDFDPSLVSFSVSDFSINAPATLQSGPTIGSNGGLQTVTIGFDNALDIGVIGTFSFTATGSVGSMIGFSLDDPGFFSSFANALPSNTPFTPNFFGTTVEITAVPVPAAAWLMLSALGAFGIGARRRGLRHKP